tara:strand:+ start:1575 stop:1781 length:207 start_codon:yes stop_codon:yes gene_type:complete
MAFKMKSGKEGPMMKNFPGAFKKEELKKKEDLNEATRRALYNRAKNAGDKEGMKIYAPKFRRNNPREK